MYTTPGQAGRGRVQAMSIHPPPSSSSAFIPTAPTSQSIHSPPGNRSRSIEAASSSELHRPSKAKSCRECIRLKHKCSRAPWPCEKCKERGIEALCPDAQLSTRPYKRGREKRQSSTALRSDIDGEDTGTHQQSRSSSNNGQAFVVDASQPPPPISQPSMAMPPVPKRARISHPELLSSSGPELHSRFYPTNRIAERHHDVAVDALTAGHSDASVPHPPEASVSDSLSLASEDGRHKHRDQFIPSSSSSSIAAGDEILGEKGTLMLGKSGKSSYYGPGSHSFLLAQPGSSEDELYSRAVSPQSQSSDDDSGDEMGQDGTARPFVKHTDATGRRAGDAPDASPRTLASNGPYNGDIVRQIILDNPVSFIAIPGVMPPFQVEHLVQQLCTHLPPLSLAKRAFRAYQQNCRWMFDPITSLTRLWRDFYSPEALSQSSGPHSRSTHHPHRISLLFCVLSLGILFDVKRGVARALQREKGDRRAERYYHWAWVALQLSNSSDSHSVEYVQAIHLIGQYLCNRKNGRNADSFFPLMGTAMRSAIAMGLHREGGAWNLSSQDLEERRRLFWELYASDCFRSLAYGRPCSVQDAHVDAVFPTRRKSHGLSDVFHEVKYQVVRLMNRILDACQRPSIPYSTVLEFDRALRALWATLPTELNPLYTVKSSDDSVSLEQISLMEGDGDELGMTDDARKLHLFLQGHTIVANINQALLHLHRPWFVRALQHDQQQQQQRSSGRSRERERERDAFDSRFARSIVAVSESSRVLIQTAQAVLDVTPTLGKSWNFWMMHCFNSAIAQCLQVVHNPSSITALGAWDDACRALAILQQARPNRQDVIWAGKIDLLRRLHERAEGQLKASHEAHKGHTRQELERSRMESPFDIPHHEQEEHLRLVGATSSIDRRGAGAPGTTGATTQEGSADESAGSSSTGVSGQKVSSHTEDGHESRQRDEVAESDEPMHLLSSSAAGFQPPPYQGANASHPALSTTPGTTLQQPLSSDASSWIPSLSHSLIGSLFESSGQSFSDDPPGVREARAAADGDQAETRMNHNNQGSRSMGGGSNRAAGESAQFDWLLTELLRGGAEPEASFWETMFGGHTNGQ